MSPHPLPAQTLGLCEQALLARGPAGQLALGWLRGDASPGNELTAALEQARSTFLLEAPRAMQPSEVLVDVLPEWGSGQRADTYVLGDLHGRWDVAAPVLMQAGLIDANESWIAPPGTCLVQIGDLLDADLSREFAASSDPRGDVLIAVHKGSLEAALHRGADVDTSRRLSAALAPPNHWSDARARALRLVVVAAALSFDTVRALIRLEREAEAADGRVVVLMGNHELDVLSGRFWWTQAQKHLWLALEGLPAEETHKALRERAGHAPSPPNHPTLAWLARRPLVARAGPLLLMHGGPTRATSAALSRADITDPHDLTAWLEQQTRQAPFDGAFYAEGTSITSPDRRRDDFVRDPALLNPWLIASRTDLLAVGHSPFLAYPPGTWLDSNAASADKPLGRLARLGPWSNVIKLDTNLKRSPTCELLRLGPEGTLTAIDKASPPRELGDTSVVPHTAHAAAARVMALVDQLRGPALIDLAAPGLDAEAFRRLSDLADRLKAELGPEAHTTVGRAVGGLLQAGPSHLEPLLDATQLALERHEPSAALGLLQEPIAKIQARATTLAGGLVAGPDGALRFSVDARRGRVGGIRFDLQNPVLRACWDRAEDAGVDPAPAIALDLVSHRGRPAARLRHFAPLRTAPVHETHHALPEDHPRTWAALEAFGHRALEAATLHPSAAERRPALERSPAESVREQATPEEPAYAVAPSRRARLPREALEALLDHNAAPLRREARARGHRDWDPRTAQASHVTLDVSPAGYSPGWFEIAAPWRLRGVVTPRGHLLLADTTFADPAARWQALQLDPAGRPSSETVLHTELLDQTAFPGRGAITLHTHLKRDVARILEADEPDLLRGVGPALSNAPSWRRGCFVFAAPLQQAAEYFRGHNPIAARFSVPRANFEEWLALGWVNLNLLISDGATPLCPSARWGAPEIALEVVAVGEEGVRALWRHRVGDR